MKSLVLIVILGMLGFSVFSQNGVNFENLTLKEALAKAKAENKLVFVDCSTTWCCSCKYMDKNVFPLEEAGTYFNARFISLHFDMDKKENEGLFPISLHAFPTFLIIRPDGSIQHKMIGGEKYLEPFIERVERGANFKTSYDYLDKLYKKGKMDKMQLIDYKLALDEAGEKEKSREIAEKMQILLTEKDKMKKEYWPIMRRSTWGSDDYRLVLQNIVILNKNVGRENVENYLVNVFANKLRFSKDSVEVLKGMKGDLLGLSLPGKELLDRKIELALAGAEHDIDKVIILTGGAVTEGKEMFWPVIETLNVVKKNTSKEEVERLLVLENECMKMLPTPKYKEFVENYFKELRFLFDHENGK